MNKEEREKLKAQKSKVMDEIRELQNKLRRVSRVPDRVVNGSYQDAVAFKDHLESLHQQSLDAVYKGATLMRLVAVKNRLQSLARVVT